MTIPQWALSIALFSAALTGSVEAQRWCTIPCGHPAHPFDVAPCSHPCYYPGGVFACHPGGDNYPCAHRVHPFDYIPC